MSRRIFFQKWIPINQNKARLDLYFRETPLSGLFYGERLASCINWSWFSSVFQLSFVQPIVGKSHFRWDSCINWSWYRNWMTSSSAPFWVQKKKKKFTHWQPHGCPFSIPKLFLEMENRFRKKNFNHYFEPTIQPLEKLFHITPWGAIGHSHPNTELWWFKFFLHSKTRPETFLLA